MRIITDDAMQVQFGLKLLDRAADHATIMLTGPGNCGTCSVGLVSNTLKDASVKWMKLECVVPTFLLG